MLAGAVEIEGDLVTEPRPYGGTTRLPLSINRVIDPEGLRIDLDSPIDVDVLADRVFGADEALRGFRYGDSAPMAVASTSSVKNS